MPPQVQQHKQGGPTGGATTLTVTLSSPTTGGNCLIVVAGATAGTGGVTGITLGGVADNWHSDAHLHQSSGVAEDIDIWSDPNCADGQTSVVLSYPSAASHAACDIWEVSGLASSLPADKSSTNSASSAGATFDSLATATTTQAAEFWAAGVVDIGASNPAITGPSSPWTNGSSVNIGGLGSYLAGQQITSSTGAAEYSGSFSPNATYAAAVVTYKGSAAAHTASASLTVTPSFTAGRSHAAVRGAALTVTPSFIATRVRGHSRTAVLTVTPVSTAARVHAAVRTAALTVTPVLHATGFNPAVRGAITVTSGQPFTRWRAGPPLTR